jgi:hypothetical protein
MQTLEQTKFGSGGRDRFLGSEFELGRHADDKIEIIASSLTSALWSKVKKRVPSSSARIYGLRSGLQSN